MTAASTAPCKGTASGRAPARPSPDVVLRPLSADDCDLAAGWLSRPEIYKWLYFGNDKRVVSSIHLRAMNQNAHNVLRLICCGPDERPVGIVGLTDLSRTCGTAAIWVARAEFDRADGKAVAERAVVEMLTLAFRSEGLASVSGWAAHCNRPSIAIARSVGFTVFGRQRACHGMDGKLYDRVHFDITRDDFEALHRACDDPYLED